ncbi:MAG: 4Fe-4S binding protein [Clostridia bacterium]|nr:4Fe-4S binding protein [Clostridia bacterium]
MRLAAKHDLCSGCRVCQVACSLEVLRENNPKKGLLKIVPHFPAPGKYEVKYCTQCGRCAEVCPVEAIALVDGVYRIDSETCIGCMTCVDECPYGVMVASEGEAVPSKCILCGACVEMCPRGAIYDADSGEGGR